MAWRDEYKLNRPSLDTCIKHKTEKIRQETEAWLCAWLLCCSTGEDATPESCKTERKSLEVPHSRPVSVRLGMEEGWKEQDRVPQLEA